MYLFYSLPTEDAEGCGFFYSKDLRILTYVKILEKLLHEMNLNWHTKKFYILSGKMPTKSFKKIVLRKNNEGILLLYITN